MTTRTKTGRKRARPRTLENEPPYSGDDFTESVKKQIRKDFSKWSNLETSNQGQWDEVIAPGKQLQDQLENLCQLSLDSVPSPCPSDYAKFVSAMEYTWRLLGCPRFLPRSIFVQWETLLKDEAGWETLLKDLAGWVFALAGTELC